MMKRLRIQLTSVTALIALLAAFPAAAQCNDGREGVLSDTFLGTTAVEWRMLVEHKAVTLTISAPCGLVVDRTYEEGQSPFFDLKEIPAADPDGIYHWSLRISPHVDPAVEKELAAAHESGDGRELEYQFRQKGLLPAGPFTQSGTFTVFRGSIVPADQKEEGAGGKLTAGVRPAASVDDCPVAAAPAVETARLGTILPAVDRGGSTRAMAAAAETPRRITGADQVIPDDLIVQGSACVGFDCVNGEAFSFDTIRLKENNLRIKFEDTSVGSFPTTDWELIANDSASGGAGKFSIRDVTANTIPFTVRAGSPANSLFVASTGRVGLRTSSPILDLHISTSNTPGIRLEQTNAGGFTAQTWDIAGNEANFFVRDVTGGSRLPFRIRPDAPTSSIDISASGDVGIGTASPSGLQVNRAVSETADNTDNIRLGVAGGTPRAIFENDTFQQWQIDNFNGAFRWFTPGVVRMIIEADGDLGIGVSTVAAANDIEHANGAALTTGGVWADASSRDYKQEIEGLGAAEAMSAFSELVPVSFRYKQTPEERYIGFIAEDVPELVAMQGRKNLAAIEVVALLTKVVQQQQQQILELTTKVDALQAAPVAN